MQFFTFLPAFEREAALYRDRTLQEMMPATHAVVDNRSGNARTRGGFVFPPCIIIERGESLERWAQRERPDFVTMLQVRAPHLLILLCNCSCAPPLWRHCCSGRSRVPLCTPCVLPRCSCQMMGMQVLIHVATRLSLLHAAGWAHRDVKPANVLRRPQMHAWTLLDFGCATRIGAALQDPWCRSPPQACLAVVTFGALPRAWVLP